MAAAAIATSAHTTPTITTCEPDSSPRTSTSPSAASPAPASVTADGRSPRRSHNQATTAAGDVYSMSSAGPTSMWATAEK